MLRKVLNLTHDSPVCTIQIRCLPPNLSQRVQMEKGTPVEITVLSTLARYSQHTTIHTVLFFSSYRHSVRKLVLCLKVQYITFSDIFWLQHLTLPVQSNLLRRIGGVFVFTTPAQELWTQMGQGQLVSMLQYIPLQHYIYIYIFGIMLIV